MVLMNIGIPPHASAARAARRSSFRARFGTAAMMLAALALAAFGVAEWVFPSPNETVAYRAWQGPQAGASTRETQVATTRAEWRSLWSGLRQDPPPAFDPSRQTGVAIMLGQRPTPGYRVNVLGTEARGERVIVVIEETRPSGDMLAQQMTSPYAILLLNRSGAPVSVEQRVRD
jgi:hypothetical protein